MKIGDKHWRRSLGRALTRQARATVDMILAHSAHGQGHAARLGVTGHPGSGKSSLIAGLAAHRLRRGRKVAVLAVDPTSPITYGSLLGDRIRMDDVCDDDSIYIRSVPSGECEDGLCRNIVGLLDTLAAAGFDDIILETVGTGQTNYRAQILVDVFALALVPESGDLIQMMKAGIMELADIYIINKADLPGAAKMVAEVRAILGSRPNAYGSAPRIVMTSSRNAAGFDELDEAIESCLAARPAESLLRVNRARRLLQLETLIEQRLREVLRGALPGVDSGFALGEAYDHVVRMLGRQNCEPSPARIGSATADMGSGSR
jgi:LAO/AO transport system kinase